MKKSVKVSVLIPTYNYARYLDEAIQSVLAQTYTDFELVIVDNCSTDNTEEVVSKYLTDSRVSYHKNKTNLGLTGNFNEVLKYANGKYIKYLMSDDKFHPQLLEKFVTVMEQYPTVSIVTSQREAFGLKEKRMMGLFSGLKSGKEVIYASLKEGMGNWIGEPSTVMFRKSDLRVGNFNPMFTTLVDFDMWMRLLTVGDCYVIPEILSYFRTHEMQASHVRSKGSAFTFEDYRFFKNIQQKNPYHIDLERADIDSMVRKRAIYCGDAVIKGLTSLHKKETRTTVKKAFGIALKEKVLTAALMKFIRSCFKKPTTPKTLKANVTI